MDSHFFVAYLGYLQRIYLIYIFKICITVRKYKIANSGSSVVIPNHAKF